MPADFRLWPLADMLSGSLNVRFQVQSVPSAGETRKKGEQTENSFEVAWGWVTPG